MMKTNRTDRQEATEKSKITDYAIDKYQFNFDNSKGRVLDLT